MLIGAIYLYRTYAFYEEKKEFNVLKGQVPDFSRITTIYMLNGSQVSNAPSSNEYIVSNVSCDKGTTATWNTSSWKLEITKLTDKEVRCTVNFIKLQYKENDLNGAVPILAEGLVPITIEDGGVVKKADLASEWYNYANKKWANAVILTGNDSYNEGATIPESAIESYFVWIPKYSYKIQTLGTSATGQEKPFEIKFGTANTSDANAGECTTPMNEEKTQGLSGESGNCQVGDYMTHPAFISMGTNGIWVGKFKTGYKGSTSTSTAQKNENAPTKVQIKPNVYSWRSINESNAFKTSYDYKRSLDSHMMKNTEWGAVAYLYHSIYGRCTDSTCEEIYINNNSSYITGWSGTTASASESPTSGYAYTNSNSVLASTTGNYSGIYDMSGEDVEHVMGGRGIVKEGMGGFTDIDIYDTKYYDTYSTSSSTIYTTRILGDATAETKGWYRDYATFVTSSYPWFGRGGSYKNTTGAGAFAFQSANGSHYNYGNGSFRVVLVVK